MARSRKMYWLRETCCRPHLLLTHLLFSQMVLPHLLFSQALVSHLLLPQVFSQLMISHLLLPQLMLTGLLLPHLLLPHLLLHQVPRIVLWLAHLLHLPAHATTIRVPMHNFHILFSRPAGKSLHLPCWKCTWWWRMRHRLRLRRSIERWRFYLCRNKG